MKTIYVVENADTGDKVAFAYREDATKYIGKCYIEDEIRFICTNYIHNACTGRLIKLKMCPAVLTSNFSLKG